MRPIVNNMFSFYNALEIKEYWKATCIIILSTSMQYLNISKEEIIRVFLSVEGKTCRNYF